MTFKLKQYHWEIIIEFMELHTDFAVGRMNNALGRETYKKLWEELTLKLNSTGCGQKTVEKWQKTWTDYKCGLKRRASLISKSRLITGGGPEESQKLSDLDMRVLAILGDTFYQGCGTAERGLTVDKKDTESVEEVKHQVAELQVSLEQPSTSTSKVSRKRQVDHDYSRLPQTPMKLFKSSSGGSTTPTNKSGPGGSPATAKIVAGQQYERTIQLLQQINDTINKKMSDVVISIDKLTEAINRRQ